MAIVAFLALTPAFLAALPPVGTFVRSTKLSSVPDLLRNPGVWLGGLVVFFYAPLEGFVSVWTVSYLANNTEPGSPPERSLSLQVNWLARFWAAFLTARLLIAFVEHAGYLGDEWADWFLVVTAFLAAAALGNLAGSFRPKHAVKALTVLGFFLGPVFPLLVGLFFRLGVVGQWPGTSFGLLFASGSVGSLVLAPLVRLSARSRNIQVALMIIPLLLALILTATALLFVQVV
jgi:fucose permease